MTKILIVSNTGWYIYNFRRQLAQHLRALGYEVVVVSPEDEFAHQMEELGFRWVNWKVGRKTLTPWTEAAALLRLYRIYHQEKPDLVHHHTIKPCLYGSLSARLLGIKGILNSITGRGYVFLGEDVQVKVIRSLVTRLYQWVFNAPNCAAIFENPDDRTYFIDHHMITPERSYLIESVGVDTQRFHPVPEPDGIPIVMLPTRMLWDKGVGVLVEAARILHKENQVRVVLVGNPDPGNPSNIPEKTLKGWHTEGVIEWWGFRPDINAVYQQAHIVAMPSMYAEGVPTVLIEAAASGLPVVTTTMPGCRDFVTNGVNGFLVSPDDAPALAEALSKLIRSKELREKMGIAGRELVEGRYTTQIVNQATHRIYVDLLGADAAESPAME